MSAAGSDAAASEPAVHVRFGRLGMIARWRPVHRGHAAVLAALCDRAEHALIGIGSANRYNFRNPFTCDETADMLRLAVVASTVVASTTAGRDNFELIPVPDLDDGPRWRALVIELFGPLDAFVSDNPYVASLLAADYRIIRPVELIPPAARIPIDGAMVRREMALGDGWVGLVPPEIADYIRSRRLDVRFRREFGLQTLALATVMD
jgi:nicotinamide mononucleotide adenylyltransferase